MSDVQSTETTYLVTSYRDPEQLYRLVGRIRRSSPNCRIVVSHDCKSSPLDSARLAKEYAEWWPTPAPVSWGDGSYLASILAAFSRLRLGSDEWVTLLSAQDYPLRRLDEYEHHLRSSRSDALLEVTSVDTADRALRRRYVRRTYRVPGTLNHRILRRAVDATPGLAWHKMPHGLPPVIERPVIKPPYGLASIRKGSDLYAANGRAIDCMLAAPSKVVDHFLRTMIPSEGFAHTILLNTPQIVVRPEMIHFTRWSASAHPDVLSTVDLPTMIQSGRWFARKFQQDDAVLNRLDDLLEN